MDRQSVAGVVGPAHGRESDECVEQYLKEKNEIYDGLKIPVTPIGGAAGLSQDLALGRPTGGDDYDQNFQIVQTKEDLGNASGAGAAGKEITIKDCGQIWKKDKK